MPPAQSSQQAGSPDDPLRRAMLDMHNSTRREVGAQPLQWDKALAAKASDYARRLAETGRFEHSRQQGSAYPYGENLWEGTRGHYSYAEMAQHWIDEKHNYRGGEITMAEVNQTGHYTQIIWRETTHLGCGVASSANYDVLVCRYSPAGNVLGERPGG